ncbi:MAG: ATP-binding protein [Verrucomicrobiae bacterium]|nr:ATP-binding protein [Verrucomicrobiae bacterium]
MKSKFIEKLIGRMELLDPKSVASIVAHLAREQGFLETVFNALDEGILVLASDHKTIYLNRAARELLGLPSGFGPGNSLRRYLPDPFWKSLAENDHIIDPQTAIHHDIEVAYPRRRLLQIYVTRLDEESSSRESSNLLIVRDVTEANRQAALTTESERLDAITNLAAGVAHEIGNPLNSLHIHLQLIDRELRHLETPGRDKLERHLKVCRDEITRLDQIVNQFLKAFRPTKPQLEPCQPNEILEQVLEVLAPEIANRDLLIEKDLPKGLPLILADRNQLKQAFFNIIRNGIHAMTKGGILHFHTELAANRILFTFRDTGGGIAPETLQRIFDPYFTTKREGSGLGLMIVERVIREHGGLLEVSSEQGRGTTFRIYLPVAEPRTRLLEG